MAFFGMLKSPDESLAEAVLAGDSARAAKAIAKGANPAAATQKGATLLHIAAGRGAWEVVRVLAEARAPLSAQDQIGRSALHCAADSGEPGAADAVSALLAAGADPNARDQSGCSPLHWAAHHARPDCLKRLLDAGAQTDPRDNGGATPLLRAARAGRMAEARKVDDGPAAECVRALLAAGADPGTKDDEGVTAAWHAGGSSMCRALLQAAAAKRAAAL